MVDYLPNALGLSGTPFAFIRVIRGQPPQAHPIFVFLVLFVANHLLFVYLQSGSRLLRFVCRVVPVSSCKITLAGEGCDLVNGHLR